MTIAYSDVDPDGAFDGAMTTMRALSPSDAALVASEFFDWRADIDINELIWKIQDEGYCVYNNPSDALDDIEVTEICHYLADEHCKYVSNIAPQTVLIDAMFHKYRRGEAFDDELRVLFYEVLGRTV